MRNNRWFKIGLVVLVVAVIAGGAGLALGHKDAPAAKASKQKTIHLDINLKDGRLVEAASTYIVQPGTRLEFKITSDKLGKISVPTEPPQTITFTESPLVFQFTTSKRPGSYVLLYMASGSEKATPIGTISVRSK
jgi:hypothetical protein